MRFRAADLLGIQATGVYHSNGGIPGPATATNSANNAAIVKNDFNPATYQGVRGELLWKFNQDWSVLLQQSYQHLDAEGVFYETPQTRARSRRCRVPSR